MADSLNTASSCEVTLHESYTIMFSVEKYLFLIIWCIVLLGEQQFLSPLCEQGHGIY